MFGVPGSETTWRLINGVGAVMLLGASVLPLVALKLWRRRGWRSLLLAVAWVIAVGCVMHGLIDDVTRVLSLLGVVEVPYPPGFWEHLDTRAADLQDLVFNETWFIVEGLLWAAIALVVIGPSPARRWWAGSAVVATLALTAIGLLTVFGVLGRFVVG